MQRLLLVDNDSDTLIELRELCNNLGFDVTTVHCTQLEPGVEAAYDMVVLSGGYWYDDEMKHVERYAAELALIRRSQIPIIGICLGMQLMHTADQGVVPLLNGPQTGPQTVRLTPEGLTILKLEEHFSAYKNHTRGIAEALPDYLTLGISTVSVEIIRHRERPLIGVQFHPELETPARGQKLMDALMAAIAEA